MIIEPQKVLVCSITVEFLRIITVEILKFGGHSMKFGGHPKKFDGHHMKFGGHLIKFSGHSVKFGDISMEFGSHPMMFGCHSLRGVQRIFANTDFHFFPVLSFIANMRANMFASLSYVFANILCTHSLKLNGHPMKFGGHHMNFGGQSLYEIWLRGSGRTLRVKPPKNPSLSEIQKL